MTKFVTILDNTGSVYIGKYDPIVSVNDSVLYIFNPAQIVFKPNEETKEVEISIFPVCYPEILSPEARANGMKWGYDMSGAKFINFDTSLNDRIVGQYEKVFGL